MTTREQIITQFEAQREEAQQALSSLENVLLGQGFVIVCEGLALTFVVQNGKVSEPNVCPSWKCVRFTREDAVQVASNVENGNGVPGSVLHVTEAIKADIAQLDKLIATLRAL